MGTYFLQISAPSCGGPVLHNGTSAADTTLDGFMNRSNPTNNFICLSRIRFLGFRGVNDFYL